MSVSTLGMYLNVGSSSDFTVPPSDKQAGPDNTRAGKKFNKGIILCNVILEYKIYKTILTITIIDHYVL